MPRSAVIAVAVIGVLALVASTGFALVRSTQLQASQQRVAALESELARDRAGDAPTEAPAPDNPLGDLFGDGEGNPLGDLFGEGGEDQLGDLLGEDAQQLARCMQPAGQPGSRDVPDGDVTQQITQIGTIVQELRGIRELISEDEVKRAQEHLKGSLMLSLENTSSRMSHLARQEIYFDRQFGLDETLDPARDIENPATLRALFYGLGSDGTVGANRLTTGVPTAHASIKFWPPSGSRLPPMNATSAAA